MAQQPAAERKDQTHAGAGNALHCALEGGGVSRAAGSYRQGDTPQVSGSVVKPGLHDRYLFDYVPTRGVAR